MFFLRSGTSEEQKVAEMHSLRQLLQLFEEADVRIPQSASCRLIDWISNRMKRSGAECRSQRQALYRLQTTLERSIDGRGDALLTDQFKSVLVNLLSGMQNDEHGSQFASADVHSNLEDMRRNAAGEFLPVQELSTLEIPWTHPGTFPFEEKSIIDVSIYMCVHCSDYFEK